MKNLIQLLCFAALVLGMKTNVSAQPSYGLNEAAQKKMSELSFLEGKWKGNGWMMGQDRVRSTFESEETIQFKLSGTLLEVEGIGKSDGKVVHHALAVISSAEGEGKFDFTSFLQSGEKGTYPAELIDGKLYWYPVKEVRYVIEINEKGQWFEIGEYNAGTAWYKFLEMTLDKVD
jgi:hypothetical protein